MKRYFVKRLLLIIPTLVIISVVAFTLSKLVPQDPAMALLNSQTIEDESPDVDLYETAYLKLGLDKPNFYFSILPHNYPSNSNSIIDHNSKKLFKRLLKLGTNIEDATAIINSPQATELLSTDTKTLTQQVSKNYKLSKFFYPRFHWHGTDNQFHKWFGNILQGNFGKSFINGQPAITEVRRALTWTFHMAFIDIIFSFCIGIFLGYLISLKPDGKKEKFINQLLYLIYAVPTFWLATLMVMYFTTDDYGTWTNIFPSVGIDIYPEKTTIQQVWLNIHKLFLPIIISSLFSIAYLARMLRRSILDQMDAPYIKTAYSKGLTKEQVVKKHAFPNALLPVITILAAAIPATLASSVVIEVIFNIPGIGRLMLNSIRVADWNIVFCIILFIGVVTALSFLIADLLYAYVNPKIRFA